MTECKLVVVGDCGVGKSALTIQVIENRFVGDYDPTIEDSFRKQIIIDGKPCILDILDTAGQEEYEAMRGSYIKTGQVFFLVYAITSHISFDDIPKFRKYVLRMKNRDQVPMVVVGNKCDLEEERRVTTDEGQELAKSFDCPFFETSAKERINVDEVFDGAIRELERWEPFLARAGKTKKKDCVVT